MLRPVITYFKLLSAVIRSQMQYRASFFFSLLTALFILAFEYISVALVFIKFGVMGGWTLGEVTVLYGFSNLSFGIMDLVFSAFDPGDFGRLVRLGSFDQILLRPVNITLQVLASSFALRRIGRIIQGLLIMVYGFSLNPIHWDLEKSLVLVSACLGMVLFFAGISIIGSTVTFWTIESIEIVNIITYGGTEMISFPMNIYPRMMVDFFTFVLPAIFLNYYPVMYILGIPDPFGFPSFSHWLAIPAGALIFTISLGVWRFGINHYQSTGT